jgi:hypothetical protein
VQWRYRTCENADQLQEEYEQQVMDFGDDDDDDVESGYEGVRLLTLRQWLDAQLPLIGQPSVDVFEAALAQAERVQAASSSSVTNEDGADMPSAKRRRR